jgi:hypothetical protein
LPDNDGGSTDSFSRYRRQRPGGREPTREEQQTRDRCKKLSFRKFALFRSEISYSTSFHMDRQSGAAARIWTKTCGLKFQLPSLKIRLGTAHGIGPVSSFGFGDFVSLLSFDWCTLRPASVT